MTPDSNPPPVPKNPEDRTLTVQMMAASPGTAVGPYKLVRQLGEGGMGVVYHAQQFQPIRRDVALKVIRPGMDSKQVVARFESERQALAMMDHPNIARVFDAGATATGLPELWVQFGTTGNQYDGHRRKRCLNRVSKGHAVAV